ncbi:collagen-like triple helix repeat-containing protein [Pusillimonas noertemannii]|nr:collagen-like triple helix repeat-containing protein [Pusillimonas noertemannii]
MTGAFRLTLLAGMLAGAAVLSACSSGSTRGDMAQASPPAGGGSQGDGGSGTGGDGSSGTGGGSGETGGNGTGGGNGSGQDGGNGATQSGALETSLGNVGQAADNVVDTEASTALAGTGGVLDGVTDPATSAITVVTQAVGEGTGTGQPADGLLTRVGTAVSSAGTDVGDTGIGGNVGTGAGALLEGAGDTVSSAGDLLNENPDNPQPLNTTLDHATGSVTALTEALGSDGGLLKPIGTTAAELGVASGDPNPVLQPALGNTGQAVDNIASTNLAGSLGNTGRSLDTVVAPVTDSVGHAGQAVGDGIGIGPTANGVLAKAGGALETAGGHAGSSGLGGAVSNVGSAVAASGGLVHAGPDSQNPIGQVLDHTTGAVDSLTRGGAGGGLLSPVSGLLGGVAHK